MHDDKVMIRSNWKNILYICALCIQIQCRCTSVFSVSSHTPPLPREPACFGRFQYPKLPGLRGG